MIHYVVGEQRKKIEKRNTLIYQSRTKSFQDLKCLESPCTGLDWETI